MSDFRVQVSYGATLNSTVGNISAEMPEHEVPPAVGEFEQFEALAAKLVNVPKEEVDAQRSDLAAG